MPFTFKNKQKAVSMFFMVGLFLLVVLGVLFAKQSDLITSKVKYYTIFTDAHGFSGGADITYRGFKIGRITSVSLTEDNNIQANLYIYKKHERLIGPDSVLRVQTNIVGSSSLTLMTFDPVPEEKISDKDTTKGEQAEKNPDGKLDKIDEKQNNNAPDKAPEDTLAETTQEDTEPLKDIKGNFGTIREGIFSSDMAQGKKILKEKAATTIAGDELSDKIAVLLDDVHTLQPELKSTLENISKSMEHMSVILASLRGSNRTPLGESVLSILKNTNETTKSLNELSAALNSPKNTVGSLARDNGTMLKTLSEVMANLEVLSKDLKTFSASTVGDEAKMEKLMRLIDENLVETKILVKGMQKVFPYRE
ncbi:MAG: MlaD family protein [Leptospirales bacterium]